MRPNRLFVSRALLDGWMSRGQVSLDGERLIFSDTGLRCRIVPALHVLREVTGAGDTEQIVGTVKSEVYLRELGGDIMGSSLLVRERAYDVSPGMLALLEEPLSEPTDKVAEEPSPASEEALLVQYLIQHLD